AAIVDIKYVAHDTHMAGPRLCEAITAVVGCIDFTSRPHGAGGEDAQDGGHHAFAAEVGLAQIASDSLAHFRQRLSKFQQTLEFLSLSSLDLTFVIEVLPTPGRIRANNLNRAAA